MAEDKAEALNQAYKLRVYFKPKGDTVMSLKEARENYVEFELPDDREPEAIAFRAQNAGPDYQDEYTVSMFADAHELRLAFLGRVNEILDATIVNAKQREAVGKLVVNAFWDEVKHYLTDRPW